ncbi:MAG: PAS domain S-box protein [Dehalococcoidia bacterium]|nr:PAS domain S-box protein [Dehalococcoidia bacterium]
MGVRGVKVGERLSASWLTRVIRRPGFWLILITLALITILHYGESFNQPSFLTDLTENLDLDRHAFERIFYLAPIIWAGFLFGRRGAVTTSVVALACMLPRAIFISPYHSDALFETGAVFVVGNLVAFTFSSLQKERVRRVYLAVVNQISGVLSQSLELNQVLGNAIDNVIDVMKVEIALVFLLDEEAGQLTLAAYRGVSEEFGQGVGGIKLGEGFNGRVAETGESLYVEDASQDPNLTKMAVREEGIRSQLIVPLKSKGRVMGTLCVATRSRRQVLQEELDLVTAIGNQIGVAVENAHLYAHEREVAEQLRVSEERYRELFENANDAIWVQDLAGNIVAANKASEKLLGYTLQELLQMNTVNVKAFLSDEGLDLAREIRRKLLEKQPVVQPYEQYIVRKDGTEATLMITTNLVTEDGKPVAFQHIGRDITEEKRMRENLSFYLQQVTMAQEEERKRIARELHDDTIQALIVLSRQLDDLACRTSDLSQDDKLLLEGLWQQTNSIMEGLRRLSQDLRPAALDRLGLLPALEWLASDVGKLSGLNVQVETDGAERRLAPEVELVLFRIVQEALRNVWRHSQATSAQVLVEFQDGKTMITVKDNGKGFQLQSPMGDLTKTGKLGLAGMKERARLLGGSLKVESEPGKGTTVIVEAPV